MQPRAPTPLRARTADHRVRTRRGAATMNILCINDAAGGGLDGTGGRQFCLAREWARLGHTVTIVAASFADGRAQQPSVSGLAAEGAVEGVRFVWLKTPRYHGDGMGRALSMLAFVGQLLARPAVVLGSQAPDVVIAASALPLDIIAARRLARQCRARLVFEENDLWPLTPGGRPLPGPLAWTAHWAEGYACRTADGAVSALPEAGEYMAGRGLPAGRFHHIPIGCDAAGWPASVRPLPLVPCQVLGASTSEERFVLGCVGAHADAGTLDTLMEAADRLRGEPLTTVVVEQGPEKERLRKAAMMRSLDHVMFLPPPPRPALPRLLASMDALYIGGRRQPPCHRHLTPGNLMDCMMAGKPIIHAVEGTGDPVAEAGCGISVPPEDPEALAGAVARLMAMAPTRRAAMGRRGRRWVLAHHDYRVLARKYLEALQL